MADGTLVSGDRRDQSAVALSEPELKALTLMIEGLRHWQIAAALSMSMKTYGTVRQGLLEKLGARTDQHAAAISFRRRLIPLDRRVREADGA